MSGLFANPELIRNLRIQLRPKRMLAAGAICAVLSICAAWLFSQRPTYDSPSAPWARDLLQLTIIIQSLVLAGGGAIACLSSIFREKERNSFDFQRVTRLSPFELAVGKLFGAPSMMYFVCLCLMPVSLFAAANSHGSWTYYGAAYAVMIVASCAFHALALLMSTLSIRGSQTGAIILILILLWVTAYGGDVSPYSVFRLSALGPMSAGNFVSQGSWRVQDLEKTHTWNGSSYITNDGMTDVLFGRHVHHFPVLLIIDSLLGLWFLLAVVRNIKRDPAEYEVYTPSQSVGFAFFLNVIFLAFFNWKLSRDADGLDSLAFLLTLNAGVLILLGLTLLRNRERTRRIVRTRADRASWIDELWPSPLLGGAALGIGTLIAVCAVLAKVSTPGSSPGFLLARVLFFALWIVRDQQYLQWASLRKGRNPLVMGVLYLSIFYIGASTLLAAFDAFRPERTAFTAFFLPTPVYDLNPANWTLRPAIWVAAYLVQLIVTGSFIALQRKQLAELAESPSAPAAQRASV